MRYITVRSLAMDKGYEWGMYGVDEFKGKSFMDLGDVPYPPSVGMPLWNETDTRKHGGIDVRSYDPEINFVEDNTTIDGGFEDDKYWGHHLEDMSKWLAVEPLNMPQDMCVIGFRGGEYASDPNLFLTKDYWEEAILRMRNKGINKFEVHTDDPDSAFKMLSDLLPEWTGFVKSIDMNWRSVRHAKHLIIANSAFYILPSLLGEAEEIIAPRYWARRNIKVWARPACYYKRFTYV
jgi:hypothetical protein